MRIHRRCLQSRVDQVLNKRKQNKQGICRGWIEGTCFECRLSEDNDGVIRWFCGVGDLKKTHDKIRHDFSLFGDSVKIFEVVASDRLNKTLQTFGLGPLASEEVKTKRLGSIWRVSVLVDMNLNTVQQVLQFAVGRLVSAERSLTKYNIHSLGQLRHSERLLPAHLL